jgi:hypothetical protein
LPASIVKSEAMNCFDRSLSDIIGPAKDYPITLNDLSRATGTAEERHYAAFQTDHAHESATR